jgi:hypothetical protein
MTGAIAIFLVLLILGAVAASATWALVYELGPDLERPARLKFLARWCGKGLLLPTAVWALMNIGFGFSLQPFMPQIQSARYSGKPWFPPFAECFGSGFFVVATYWMAATLLWRVVLFARALPEEAHGDFKVHCSTYGLGLLIPAAIIGAFGGWPLLGLALAVILAPLAASLPNATFAKKEPPMYARAIARIKFGKYSEAENEILAELEKCEDDFEGWMMLAELYATQYKDLAEAERTVMELCDQPNLTPSQLSLVLHRLADWQLKLGENPAAARRSLQHICQRLAGTHLAYMAQLRINRLPATREDLRDETAAKPIPLPALRDPLDQETEAAPTELEHRQAAQEAKECVQRLTANPNHQTVREHFARLLTERLQQPDKGIEQLTLLLNLPEQSPAKKSEWISLIAAWHLHRRQDIPAARLWLRRLLRDYPDSLQAPAAKRWLERLEADEPSAPAITAPAAPAAPPVTPPPLKRIRLVDS